MTDSSNIPHLCRLIIDGVRLVICHGTAARVESFRGSSSDEFHVHLDSMLGAVMAHCLCLVFHSPPGILQPQGLFTTLVVLHNWWPS
jgi:hypothetical protein